MKHEYIHIQYNKNDIWFDRNILIYLENWWFNKHSSEIISHFWIYIYIYIYIYILRKWGRYVFFTNAQRQSHEFHVSISSSSLMRVNFWEEGCQIRPSPRVSKGYESGLFLGGSIPPGEGQKLGKRGFSRRRRRRKNFWALFWNFFGKFIDKNAIKSVFWGGLRRNISKVSTKCPFFRSFRDISTKTPHKYIYQGAEDPPPQK